MLAHMNKLPTEFTQSLCHVFQDKESGELYVAIGDGRQLPYRQFIQDSVFQMARSYFLSPTSNITAVNPRKLAGLIGAMLARQSRAPGTVIEVLVNEFLVTDPDEAAELGVNVGDLREGKLDALIERILIQYGDDSVQELEFSTVLFNSVSNLAAKAIEDRRLGAFIEQSSRYVYYNQKDPITDSWYYYRPEEILNSHLKDRYIEVMDACFELYAKLADQLETHYRNIKPLESCEYAIKPNDKKKYRFNELDNPKQKRLFKRTYGFDIRTKAADTSRIMLPAGTLTSLAMVANGRTFEHLLKRLYSSPYGEFKDIARKGHETLNKVIPKYVKRANPEGEKFWMQVDDDIRNDLREAIPAAMSFDGDDTEVKLLDVPRLMSSDPDARIHYLAAAYFPYARTDYGRIVNELRALPAERVAELFRHAIGARETRRDRSPRGFEHGYDITAEIVGDFGIFRDLHRHRMCTLQWQRPNPHLGFIIPQDIVDIGLADECRAVEQQVRALYDDISSSLDPYLAEYVTLFGHKIRFTIGMNLRESQHLLELRTVKQGHPNYRRVCQKIHNEMRRRAPWIDECDVLKFVDHNSYSWARADAEARQSQKMIERKIDDEMINE